MGELHMFFPDRSGISMEGDEQPREFVWTFCDVCNKPQERTGVTFAVFFFQQVFNYLSCIWVGYAYWLYCYKVFALF